MGQYIVDFVSFHKIIVIEVDGVQYNSPVTAENDTEEPHKWKARLFMC